MAVPGFPGGGGRGRGTPTPMGTNLLLKPANEVWGKVMFSEASVILSTAGGVCIGGGVGLHPGEGLWMGGSDRLLLHRILLGYVQRAGGTHPTGIHSCLAYFYPENHLKMKKKLDGEIFLRQLASHFRRIIGGLCGDSSQILGMYCWSPLDSVHTANYSCFRMEGRN